MKLRIFFHLIVFKLKAYNTTYMQNSVALRSAHSQTVGFNAKDCTSLEVSLTVPIHAVLLHTPEPQNL